MKRLLQLTVLPLFIGFVFSNCQSDVEKREAARPLSPWVFRSVIDAQPRMITIALDKDLFAAYRTDSCAIYKVWNGGVNLDGAVYTSNHGPQPATLGDAYFVNEHHQPWKIYRKSGGGSTGTMQEPTVQYRGHRFDNGQVTLEYELKTTDGLTIKVNEKPEFTRRDDGLAGFERTFTTENVPADAVVSLETNMSSVLSEKQVYTEGGTFKLINSKPRNYGDLLSQDLEGELTLKSNGTTRFVSYFVKKAMIENENKIVDEEELKRPEGLKLINKNDCRTCHNELAKTVGPSYTQIAQKYTKDEATVATLTAKVKNGGAGNWGLSAMSAHPTVAETDIRKMVDWILDLDANTEGSNDDANDESPSMIFTPSTAITDEDSRGGALVNVYQFDRHLENFKDIMPMPAPKFSGIMGSLYLDGASFGGMMDNFLVVATGFIKIAKTDDYTFRITSDDGSRLFIGDKLLINNDGSHGNDAKDGNATLAAGFYPFRLEYFQGGGGKALSFSWDNTADKEQFVEIESPTMLHSAADDAKIVEPNLPFTSAKQKTPGDASPLKGVHPAFKVEQARPNDFAPMVGGMDFLADGRMIVSTWDKIGGVYIISNATSGDAGKMRTKKIAEGLAEPLGLKVVGKRIFVLQKHELTELIDHNGDEIIDEYRTVCNKWKASANFHEFAFGLVEKNGWLYGALATAILPGGASARPQITDRGKVFRVKIADGTLEFVARGLRTPNTVGIGVDGEIFVNDNQGDWLPACKLLHVTEGAFFGSYSVDSINVAQLPVKQPVVWLPQDEIGNSASQMTAFKDGVYKGQMLHGEVTNGGLKRVFIEKINGEYQGCAFHFSQGFEAGVNRLVWGPDGALYVGGIGNPGNWNHEGDKWFGLQRFSSNGNSAFEPLAIRAKTNGLEIEMTEPLAEGDGWNPADFEVKQWWYKPTINYGGPKMDEEMLTIKSANVSADRRKVFLEFDGAKPQHVIYVHLKKPYVSELGHELWITEGFYTMNSIPQNAFGTKTGTSREGGTGSQYLSNLAANLLTANELRDKWQLLFNGKDFKNWHNFKKKTVGNNWIVDSTEQAIQVHKVEGSTSHDGGDLTTDEEYENFELRLDWKISACGNSGIIYNVIENDQVSQTYQSGPEMQVLDNSCHPDAKIIKHRAGDLYDLISCKFENVKPAGQWNSIRLKIKNGKVEHWQNGRKLVEYDQNSPKWKAMIAGSKFKSMPLFGTSRKGHIALQDHGDKVWYRNIKIRKL
jgi:cytochrome c